MQSGKNIRLFKNPVLEQLTYVHPLLPIALWGPMVAYWFGAGLWTQDVTLRQSVALAAAGFIIWTISEYALHRWVFHFKPHGPIQERIAFLIHGIHHEDPADARRLLMPPAAGIAIAVCFYAIFTALLGLVHVKPFFAGFITGYLCYDYTHFAVHFANPKWKFFKALKHNHMQHHFVSPEKRFGVSSPLWDHFFGTRG